MNIAFKLCNELDLVEVVQVAKDTFVNAFEKDNNPKDFKKYITEAFSRESVLRQLKNKDSRYYFVVSDNNVIGYFKVNQFNAQTELQEKDGLELERIYIIEQYQGCGIGVQILNKVVAFAKEKSKEYIWLGVWEHNKRAIKWYQKQGFEKFGTHPFFMGTDEQTDWLMKKPL